MKFLFFTLFVSFVAANHKQPLSLINIYGTTPDELIKDRATLASVITSSIPHRVLGIRDIFEKPLFVITPTVEHPESFTSYYIQQGLRSIKETPAFKTVHDYLKTPDLSGFLFYPKGIYNTRLFESVVDRVVLPDNFKMSDYLSFTSIADQVPFLLLMPKAQFQTFHFNSYTQIANFVVYDDIIEASPETVVTQPPSKAQQLPYRFYSV